MGLALAGLVGLGGAHAQTFLGFRLLDFDGIFVRWGGTGAEPVTVTYAFVEQSVQFKDARNCTGHGARRRPSRPLEHRRVDIS